MVETLKEFHPVLLLHYITVYMDRNNLTHRNFTTERVLCWRFLLEEYIPIINDMNDLGSCAADDLSNIPLINSDITESNIKT